MEEENEVEIEEDEPEPFPLVVYRITDDDIVDGGWDG